MASLTGDEKKILDAAALDAMKRCKEEVAKVEKTGVDQLRGMGLQVVEKIDTAKFQDLLKPTFAELAKRFGEIDHQPDQGPEMTRGQAAVAWLLRIERVLTEASIIAACGLARRGRVRGLLSGADALRAVAAGHMVRDD